MAYNFGGKQQSQQPVKQPPKTKGKGSGVTIDKPVYKPTSPKPEPSQPQRPPTNTNIEGNVTFNKTIYSRGQFDQLVDNGFSELTQRQDDFNTDQFFEQYNRLFFDIPKDGQNSHRTLVDNSTTYLGNFTDTRDDEIARLNEIIADLQVQLASSNDVEVVREHPFFKNGTLVEDASTDDVFYMDQGHKRKINYTVEFYETIKQALGYKTPESVPDNIIPIASARILNAIPSGPNVDPSNFGDPFIPNTEESDAQTFGLELDPTDAALDPALIADKYGGDSEAYRIDLEKDYQEKTIAIDTLTEKINNPNESEDAISGYEIAKANLIARRATVEFILENFEAIIIGSVVVNVLPNITNEQLATDPGFSRVYTKAEIEAAIDELFVGNNSLIAGLKNRVGYLSSSPKLNQIRNNTPEFVNTTKMYHKIWVEANEGNIEQTALFGGDSYRDAVNEALNKLYRDNTQSVATTR